VEVLWLQSAPRDPMDIKVNELSGPPLQVDSSFFERLPGRHKGKVAFAGLGMPTRLEPAPEIAMKHEGDAVYFWRDDECAPRSVTTLGVLWVQWVVGPRQPCKRRSPVCGFFVIAGAMVPDQLEESI
jgi:hypothetical protein